MPPHKKAHLGMSGRPVHRPGARTFRPRGRLCCGSVWLDPWHELQRLMNQIAPTAHGAIASVGKGLHEETLRAMLEAGAAREVLVSHQAEKWILAAVALTRCEALRTWASLTAVGRFAESAGIRVCQVEV